MGFLCKVDESQDRDPRASPSGITTFQERKEVRDEEEWARRYEGLDRGVDPSEGKETRLFGGAWSMATQKRPLGCLRRGHQAEGAASEHQH